MAFVAASVIFKEPRVDMSISSRCTLSMGISEPEQRIHSPVGSVKRLLTSGVYSHEFTLIRVSVSSAAYMGKLLNPLPAGI